jgi:phospholipid/cholesterol/gamma-HCH transport system substrate-binding protein
METRAHYIIVGLFTLTAGAFALLFALWMSRSATDNDVVVYDVIFREAVSGLSVGSPVQYSGIRVGEVERLRLDPQDPRQVWARVRISSSAPVKVDTLARLTMLNITGAAGIELSQGLPSSPLLTAEQGSVPIIQAAQSSLARLRLNSDELLISITSLLDRANQMLSAENGEYVTRILSNVEVVTTNLVEQQATLGAGLARLASAGEALNQLLARVDEQIAEHGDPLLNSAAETMVNMQRFTQQMTTLMNDNEQALTNGMQSFNELGPAIEDLRGVLSGLNDITNRLEEDPAGFLLGDDNIKEYQP